MLGWTGTAICLLMSVLVIVGAANMPPPSVQPAAAPAPTLSAVPNVVGMSGQRI
ncbi:hypothetical protein HBB16_09255 [Pseudonocardia sp. MCCB 268]|nr:hypothetical protein [Pseudonocardia cytotoxica]